MATPKHMTPEAINEARERDRNGDSRRMTINVELLKVLITLAHREIRVGRYNKDVNDLVITMKTYMEQGMFDTNGKPN